MKKSLIYAVPIALMAAQAVAASPAGWGGMATHDRGAATAGGEAAPLVLVGYRGGGWWRPRQPSECQPRKRQPVQLQQQ